MNILVVLIPVSLILGGLGLAAFLWSLRSNQYEDLEGDAWRILSEDDTMPRAKDVSPKD
jgi:cbb3-type cytochrome oxidase maturation protein